MSLLYCITYADVNNISKEIKNDCPEIPWQEIIGMRNRLIHAYFNINLDILWKTITEDLPPLIAGLENIITQAEAHENHH